MALQSIALYLEVAVLPQKIHVKWMSSCIDTCVNQVHNKPLRYNTVSFDYLLFKSILLVKRGVCSS